MKSITDSTGVSIQIPRDDETSTEKEGGADEEEEIDPEHGPLISISLSGSSSGVDSAKSQILAIVRERTSKTSLELPDVPQELWIFLRGKSDELVSRVQEGGGEGEVNLFVPRRVPAGGKRGVDVEEGAGESGESNGEVKEKVVRITGDKELVKKLESFVQDEINELVSQITFPLITFALSLETDKKSGGSYRDQLFDPSFSHSLKDNIDSSSEERFRIKS